MLSPRDEALDIPLLTGLLGSADSTLKLETVRTLQTSRLPGADALLREVASDAQNDVNLRAEAVLGLARRAIDSRLRLFEDTTVSGHHCEIRIQDSGLIIEDVGSRNGTLVNGKRVESTAKLVDGDTIDLGAARLTLEVCSDRSALSPDQ